MTTLKPVTSKACFCCGEEVVQAGFSYDREVYCSAECIEHVQELEQENEDSYLLDDEDESGEYRSLYQ